VEPGAADRQRVEERAVDHVDVEGAVVRLTRGLVLLVLHQPHVLFVAGDVQLTFTLGHRNRQRQALGGAAVVGDQVVGRTEGRVHLRRGGHDAAVRLDAVTRQLHPNGFHSGHVVGAPRQYRRPIVL